MKTELKRKLVDGLFGFGVVAGLVAFSGVASAQDLSDSVTSVHNNLAFIPNLISGGCYIIGAALVGAGLLKLKAFSENPAQTPIQQGLGRIVIGAMLLAAPAITGWIASSVGATGTALAGTGLSNIN